MQIMRKKRHLRAINPIKPVGKDGFVITEVKNKAPCLLWPKLFFNMGVNSFSTRHLDFGENRVEAAG